MSAAEKTVVLIAFIGQLLFVAVGVWALEQPDLGIFVDQWVIPISAFLFAVSFAAVVLLIRDLYKRPFKSPNAKLTWLLAMFLTGGIGIVLYAFVHAFKSRETIKHV